jgi:hypothetical protein
MNPDELAKLVEELIFNADTVYGRQITRIQNALYADVLVILKDLKLDPDGYILQSAENRKLLDQADTKIYEVFRGVLYNKVVSDYVSVITKLDTANQKYFSTFPKFKENRMFLKSLQQQAIQTVEKNILQDGLQAQVINPLSEIMNQNINSGGKFSGFLEQIRNYIRGNEEVEGRAMRYTRTFLKDALFNYARTYQIAVTKDLGLEWFLYSGGVMDKTRDFCLERTGRFFTQTEIEKWADEDWAGKKQGTTSATIFIYCGGWNCGHQLIPVDSSIVPIEDKDRLKSENPSL